MQTYTTIRLLLIATVAICTTANAQSTIKRICYNDNMGYTYVFRDIVMTGEKTAYGKGTEDGRDLREPWNAEIWIDFTQGMHKGNIRIRVINPRPVNCYPYTDSFIETGTASILKMDDGTIIYKGSGTWESYCYGGIVNSSGTWKGEGPCSNNSRYLNATTPSPNNSSGKVSAESSLVPVSVSPNPVQNYSRLQYTVAAASRVSITIYNSMQQPVKVLVNEIKSAGTYSVTWNALQANGSPVPAGIYRVVAIIGERRYSVMMQVIK